MQPIDKNVTADEKSPPTAINDKIVRRRRLTATIFLTLIALLLTSTPLVIGGVLIYRNTEAYLWHKTTGLLLDAHIDKHPGSKTPLPDIPVVSYEYTVDGKVIKSDKWSPAGYGLDIVGSINDLKNQKPLTVYYNPLAHQDSAVVHPPASIGFFPFVLGLGMFCIMVITFGGGMLFSCLHPDIAADPNSRARHWIIKSFRIGLALMLSSITGIVTLITRSEGGWWQWTIAICLVAFAATRSQVGS